MYGNISGRQSRVNNISIFCECGGRLQGERGGEYKANTCTNKKVEMERKM